MAATFLTRLGWVLMAGLALLVVLLSTEYLSAAPEDYPFGPQRLIYAQRQTTLLAHIGFSMIALLLGPLQFWTRLRRRRKSIHRALGVTYAVSVLIGAIGGLMLATTAYTGLGASVGFATLSILWATSTLMAVNHAMRGSIVDHGRWMIRSYALTFAAVTLRLELAFLMFVAGYSQAEAYTVVAWSGWVFNLIAVEWLVIGRRKRSSRVIASDS